MAAGVLLAACRGADTAPRLPEGTPVILFSIDTLRSDRLPVYGHRQVETPAIDAFAAESIVFDHAYTHVPMTLPAHASLFSGLEPNRHGVRANVGYQVQAGEHAWLPKLLADAGYRTGAAVSAMVLRQATGIAEGFDFYQDDIVPRRWGQLGESQRSGHDTLAALRPWLAEQSRQPLFLFFHIFEPHRPFEPPDDLADRYGRTYDAEVAASDRVAEAFFAELESLGLYQRSLIILLSDHGEGLGDHGDPEHGPLLYREVLQVPLIVRLPGGERGGSRVTAPVQLVDVLPTITGALGIDTPDDQTGHSLLGALPDTRPLYAETYYPRIHFGWSQLTGIIEYPYHLIRGPDLELYDLRRDPQEQHNLVSDRRQDYARLRDALDRHPQDFSEPGEVSTEVREQLATLGYLGSPARGEVSMADPKTRLPVLRDLSEAYRLFLGGEHAAAVARYRRVLEQEPRLTDAWEYLGHALMQTGAADEALAAYGQAIELSGGSSHLMLGAAGALLVMGRLEEAKGHATAAAHSFPGDAGNLLARIALRENDPEGASRHLEEALEVSPGHPTYLVTKARLLLAQGDLAAVQHLTDHIEKSLDPETDVNLVRGLYFTRGEAEARLGNGDTARDAFEREIEMFPHELSAYTHLALLHALRGSPTAAGGTLRRMIDANPGPRAYAEAANTMRVLGDEASASRLIAQGRQRWPDSDVWQRARGG